MQSPPFNPQQYGESQVASQDFVDDLNRVQRQSSFPSSGEGMSRWVNNQVSGPTSGMCVDTTEVDSGADYSAVMSDEEKVQEVPFKLNFQQSMLKAKMFISTDTIDTKIAIKRFMVRNEQSGE